MSEESKNFTKEEKASIALKAVSGGDDAFSKLADEHDVSVETIKEWARETGVAPVETSVDNDDNEVSLIATEDFESSVEFGATRDDLNIGRLTFWTIFGTSVILLIVVAIMNIYEYSFTSADQLQSERSQFYNIQNIEQEAQAHLNSFGVVDLEEGIYRIPVDSAIAIMASDIE
jgi:hypothetical protein